MRGDGRVTTRSSAAHVAIGVTAFLAEHIETPSQHADRHGATGLQPEKRLMLRVLEEAIETWQRYRAHPTPEARGLARAAADWLSSDDESYLFDYRRVCEAVGIDADYLRRGLRAWQERTPEPMMRSGRTPRYDVGLLERARVAIATLRAAGYAERAIGPAIGKSKMAAAYWRTGKHAISGRDTERLERLVAQVTARTTAASA